MKKILVLLIIIALLTGCSGQVNEDESYYIGLRNYSTEEEDLKRVLNTFSILEVLDFKLSGAEGVMYLGYEVYAEGEMIHDGYTGMSLDQPINEGNIVIALDPLGRPSGYMKINIDGSQIRSIIDCSDLDVFDGVAGYSHNFLSSDSTVASDEQIIAMFVYDDGFGISSSLIETYQSVERDFDEDSVYLVFKVKLRDNFDELD
jgi:uncharacterized protein YceK